MKQYLSILFCLMVVPIFSQSNLKMKRAIKKSVQSYSINSDTIESNYIPLILDEKITTAFVSMKNLDYDFYFKNLILLHLMHWNEAYLKRCKLGYHLNTERGKNVLNNLMIEALKTNSKKYKNKDDVYFRIGAVEDYIINENPSLLRNKKIKREINKIEDYSKKCF